MTPEILEKARPYLRTYGSSTINLNTADEPVLRAIPGMTDVILARILAARTGGQRITNVNNLLPPTSLPRPGQPQTAQQRLAQSVQSNSVTETVEVELTITAAAGPQALPATLHATITRPAGNNRNAPTTITWRQW
jgi:hypothetical protein